MSVLRTLNCVPWDTDHYCIEISQDLPVSPYLQLWPLPLQLTFLLKQDLLRKVLHYIQWWLQIQTLDHTTLLLWGTSNLRVRFYSSAMVYNAFCWWCQMSAMTLRVWASCLLFHPLIKLGHSVPCSIKYVVGGLRCTELVKTWQKGWALSFTVLQWGACFEMCKLRIGRYK